MPLLAEDPSASTEIEHIEQIRIGLPSELAPALRQLACPDRLQEMEARLRESQARDALQDLRNQLHIINHLYRYKQNNVRHQGANTRVRTDLATQDDRKNRAVEKYRRARRAKLALSGPGPWEAELRPLEDQDVRGLQEENPIEAAKRKRKRGQQPGPAEGHRTLSWIWLGSDADGNKSMTDSLRVEWLKARSRKMRWEEETRLLPEEMRRVLATLRYEETRWQARADAPWAGDDILREGIAAYANKQAYNRRAMRRTFTLVCRPIATTAPSNIVVDWEDIEGQLGEPEDDAEGRTFMEVYHLDGEDLAPLGNA